MIDQPVLFGPDTRVKELEADLQAAYREQTRLSDLYSRYRGEAKEVTARTRALLRQEAWAAVTSTDTFNQPLIAEIKWLRHRIALAGRVLHRQFGRTDGTQCDCVGCELIVGTDLREPGEVPEGEFGPRSSLQQRLIAAETERDQARGAFAAYKALSPERTQ